MTSCCQELLYASMEGCQGCMVSPVHVLPSLEALEWCIESMSSFS